MCALVNAKGLWRGEEGMLHAYTAWHDKIQTGRQDMLNLDSAHCNSGNNVAVQAMYMGHTRMVAVMETTIYSSIFEICHVHAFLPTPLLYTV